MNYTRLTNYFEDTLNVSPNASYILADLPANCVHIVLSSIETRKGRSFWVDKNAWIEGLQALCEFQRRLLMDSTERIISEVRALRDGDQTPLEWRDPTVDPYTFPAWSLRDIGQATFEIRESTNNSGYGGLLTVLEQIRDNLAAGGETGVLDRLDQIILLLGAAA